LRSRSNDAMGQVQILRKFASAVAVDFGKQTKPGCFAED
jgi:hypothetical protein